MAEASDASRPWASVKIEKGKVVGKDGSVWISVNIPQGPRCDKIPMNVQNKRLELVRQKTDLKVHVNPDPDGLDFWEKPAGSGSGDWIGTPLDRTSIKKKTHSPATEREPAKVLKKDPESGYNIGSIWVPESGYSSESSWVFISTEAATAATATATAATDQSKENEEATATAAAVN